MTVNSPEHSQKSLESDEDDEQGKRREVAIG